MNRLHLSVLLSALLLLLPACHGSMTIGGLVFDDDDSAADDDDATADDDDATSGDDDDATEPTGCNVDFLEPNDAPDDASLLSDTGPVQGLTSCPGDDDWYRFELVPGQELVVEVVFFHSEGDIDVELIGRDGDLLDDGTGGEDNELVVGWVDEPGAVHLRVYLWEDLGDHRGNDYALFISIEGGPVEECLTDYLEPNDTIETSVDLDPGLYDSLAVCDDDVDWYSFFLEDGQSLEIAVYFSHAEGDIDVVLYSSDGEPVADSDSGDDHEFLGPFDALGDGVRFLEVYLWDDHGSAPGNVYEIELIVGGVVDG